MSERAGDYDAVPPDQPAGSSEDIASVTAISSVDPAVSKRLGIIVGDMRDIGMNVRISEPRVVIASHCGTITLRSYERDEGLLAVHVAKRIEPTSVQCWFNTRDSWRLADGPSSDHGNYIMMPIDEITPEDVGGESFRRFPQHAKYKFMHDGDIFRMLDPLPALGEERLFKQLSFVVTMRSLAENSWD